jgi:hypothetical protein
MSDNNACDIECTFGLVADDVVPLSEDSTRIVFASLYTYADNKDESAFQKVHLPNICIGVGDLYSIFYQTKLKRFSPFVLNKLISKLSKLPLMDAVLSNYEAQTGNDRLNLTAQQKIMLRQELSTVNINSRIQKIVHLNSDDFIESFDDELVWFDEVAEIPAADAILDAQGVIIEAATDRVPEHHSVRTSVEINIFSESLQTGVILVVHFTAYVNQDFYFVPIPEVAPIAYDADIGTTIQTHKCGLCVTYDSSNDAP